MGTVQGGKKAAETNKRKFGEDFYRDIAQDSQKAWIENGRKPRGLAAMSPEKRQEISLRGVERKKEKRNAQQSNL